MFLTCWSRSPRCPPSHTCWSGRSTWDPADSSEHEPSLPHTGSRHRTPRGQGSDPPLPGTGSPTPWRSPWTHGGCCPSQDPRWPAGSPGRKIWNERWDMRDVWAAQQIFLLWSVLQSCSVSQLGSHRSLSYFSVQHLEQWLLVLARNGTRWWWRCRTKPSLSAGTQRVLIEVLLRKCFLWTHWKLRFYKTLLGWNWILFSSEPRTLSPEWILLEIKILDWRWERWH